MKRGSATSLSHSKSEAFLNSGTANYRHGGGTKADSNRNYRGNSALVQLSNGRRALPSKWEDAERWILSPVSGDETGRKVLPQGHLRRPKSKSGPIGSSATIGGALSSASPLVPCFDNGKVGNFPANSPFLAGVLIPDALCSSSDNGGRGSVDGDSRSRGDCYRKRRSLLGNGDSFVVRSASVHGWSDTLIESSSSLPSSQDEKFEDIKEDSRIVSPTIIKEDVGVQMSPEGSATSSSKERPFTDSKSPQPIEKLQNQFTELEIRGVEADDRITVTTCPKKYVARSQDKHSTSIIKLKNTTVEADSSARDPTEAAKSISKFKKEDAKITAWENLQKAKAEAEIRKLEVKLEKRRLYSIDKILNRLRLAQSKAQEMRTSVNARKNNQVTKNTKKLSYFRTDQITSLSGCFTCHTL